MATLKLSYRAKLLLALIRESTEMLGGEWHNSADASRLKSFWIPRAKPETCDLTGDPVAVSGASDVQVLRSLERKGLIAPVRGTVLQYAYRCTEDGLAHYESVLRAELVPA